MACWCKVRYNIFLVHVCLRLIKDHNGNKCAFMYSFLCFILGWNLNKMKWNEKDLTLLVWLHQGRWEVSKRRRRRTFLIKHTIWLLCYFIKGAYTFSTQWQCTSWSWRLCMSQTKKNCMLLGSFNLYSSCIFIRVLPTWAITAPTGHFNVCKRSFLTTTYCT